MADTAPAASKVYAVKPVELTDPIVAKPGVEPDVTVTVTFGVAVKDVGKVTANRKVVPSVVPEPYWMMGLKAAIPVQPVPWYW